jgi:hypothetical protein
MVTQERQPWSWSYFTVVSQKSKKDTQWPTERNLEKWSRPDDKGSNRHWNLLPFNDMNRTSKGKAVP